MLLTIFHKSRLIPFGMLAVAGITFSSCSSLSQQAYDVDGIYNNSKIVVEDTHEKSAYYTEYFKELEGQNDEFFTDIDNYSSNYQANGGWGDTTTETTILYNDLYSNWGWGYPYGGWYSSYWGLGFGWSGYWGYPYYYGYGWGHPYYGYGWGYPYYSYRNVSRSNSYRNMNSRMMRTTSNRLSTNNTRTLQRNAINNSRLNTNKTFAREASTVTRMNAAQNQMQRRSDNSFDTSRRSEQFNNRSSSNRVNNNRVNTNRVQRNTTTRPTSTPSSTRMNSGGSFGGSRSSGSMGGGMRSGGGRR